MFRGKGEMMNYNPDTDMVEVHLPTPDDFLKVKETLSRIGIASKDEKRLYQSCHIFHKQRKYFIVHFKELFALDGKPSDISENDVARRNTIIGLLLDWGLISLPDGVARPVPCAPLGQIKVLPFREKSKWQLVAKYEIGAPRNLPRVMTHGNW